MIADGHMDIDTWSRIFFITGGIDDHIFNVHYGCLQHFHSMAPIQRLEAKSSAATRVVFTNTDVLGFTLGQIKMWWNLAVSHKTDKSAYSWYLGHILHTVQDSYPRGHVVRASTTTDCGPVVTFQGYDAQHGNDGHKGGDFTPASSKHESDPTLSKRYQCAIDASTHILQAFVACKNGGACTFDALSAWLKSSIYNLAAGAATRTAGGTRAEFAKKGIEADFVKEVANGVTLWNPKSTKKWSSVSGTRLCQGSKAIIGKAPEKTLGIKHYVEKPFGQYVNYAAPSNSA